MVMHIAILLPRPLERPTGGYAVQYEYANRLVARGHRVTIVHAWSGDRPHRSQWMYYWQELGRLARRREPVVTWFALDGRVRVRLVPYLHARFLPRADVFLFTAWQTVARFAGPIPDRAFHFVYDYEFWQATPELRTQMLSVFRHAGLRRIAGSRAVAAMLAEAGSDAIATVPCGIDLERWRVRRDVAKDDLLVGFPLRNEPHKGMPEAFEALDKVRVKLPGTSFAAFGEAAEVTAPGFVRQRGRLSDDALCAFYNECAVFLLPSRYEGWGLPAAEAMACGTPVVTTANGGTEDFAIDGETAVVVAPGDAAAMAEAICRLLSDPQLRSRIASTGRRRISQMSWDAATDALLTALLAA
jgi:glycosyltransferase involved in cell wall biosynthesis